MMSPCEHITYDGVLAVLRLDPGVPVAYGVDGAGLHGAHRLAAGEGRGRGVLLDDLHQRFVGEFGELAARPVAVVALADPLVGVQGQLGPGVEQRLRGSPGSAAAGW